MFAIVDIETCGPKFAYQKGRIIDICILVHDGLQVIDKFSTLINPECHIGGFYTQLSGITNEMVKDAPKFHEVAKEIISFTEDKIFVAHNSAFDYHFIRDEFSSLGYRFKRETLCTVKLSRKLLPGKRSYSLGNLCASLGIEIKDRHRAEGDAVATAKLLDILLQVKTQSREFKSAGLQQIMSTRKENIKAYILEKIPESCGVYYFRDKEGQIIYIGKSVNMYQRAQSHYQTDLKKNQAMLHELTDVDVVETGSELISLLFESHEIKRHKPLYNRQRKKDLFTHVLQVFSDEEGILHLEIKPWSENNQAWIMAFTTYASARERLDALISAKELCLKYCGLADPDTKPCFHAQIKQCRGICSGLESVEDYNERVKDIVRQYTYDRPNFVILERGRHAEERAFTLIQDYQYQGYGYVDVHTPLHQASDWVAHIQVKALYADDHAIVRGWINQKRREMLIL